MPKRIREWRRLGKTAQAVEEERSKTLSVSSTAPRRRSRGQPASTGSQASAKRQRTTRQQQQQDALGGGNHARDSRCAIATKNALAESTDVSCAITPPVTTNAHKRKAQVTQTSEKESDKRRKQERRTDIERSTSMVLLIEANKDKVKGAGPDTYDSLSLILAHVDRYVDVMNGQNKDCECINSSEHPHVKDLLDFIQILTEWKNESPDSPECFIPKSTYEDLCWTVFSIIGVADKIPEGRAMVQKRHGSDVCEKEYGKVRQKNANPTTKDARHLLSHAMASNSQTLKSHRKTNAAGDKVLLRSEITATLPRRPKKQE